VNDPRERVAYASTGKHQRINLKRGGEGLEKTAHELPASGRGKDKEGKE